jgi:hypothetical protein
MSKRNLYLGITALSLLVLNFYVKSDGFKEKVKSIKINDIEKTTSIKSDRNLETWIDTFQDSVFSLENKDYSWKEFALYDINNNGKDDGILIIFNKNKKPNGSIWTGAVGYFEFYKEGEGKINPNAKIVYPFRKWDSEKPGKGLKDTNGNGTLNKIMNFKETMDFSKAVHYKTKKKGKAT